MSLRLAEFLLTQNRGVPKKLTEVPLQTFQTCFAKNGDVLVIRYKDKQDVYLLCTKHTAGFAEKSRYHVNVQKPSTINHYNVNMGVVDGVDQDVEPYKCIRKSYSWFKKIGFHIIQRMVLNSRVMYCNANEKNTSILGFTKLLKNELLSE